MQSKAFICQEISEEAVTLKLPKKIINNNNEVSATLVLPLPRNNSKTSGDEIDCVLDMESLRKKSRKRIAIVVNNNKQEGKKRKKREQDVMEMSS